MRESRDSRDDLTIVVCNFVHFWCSNHHEIWPSWFFLIHSYWSYHLFTTTGDCKIVGTSSTVFNGFLYRFMNGKSWKTVVPVPIILQLAVLDDVWASWCLSDSRDDLTIVVCNFDHFWCSNHHEIWPSWFVLTIIIIFDRLCDILRPPQTCFSRAFDHCGVSQRQWCPYY